MLSQVAKKIKCFLGYHDYIKISEAYWEDPYQTIENTPIEFWIDAYVQETLKCARCHHTLVFSWSYVRPKEPKYRDKD